MGHFSHAHAGCPVRQTNMPDSAKDTLGKPRQSFGSSSCTSFLFVTAAHTRLPAPFREFISFRAGSGAPGGGGRGRPLAAAPTASVGGLSLAGISVRPLAFQAGTQSGTLTTRFSSARMFAVLP